LVTGQIDARPNDPAYSDLIFKKYSKAEIDKVCHSLSNVTKIEGIIEDFTERDCGDLSADRCEHALNQMKTFKADFEWTRAQNKVGYDFANANCPRIGMKEDPLAYSCESLQTLESNLSIDLLDEGRAAHFSPVPDAVPEDPTHLHGP
jgi:hypothetical protein